MNEPIIPESVDEIPTDKIGREVVRELRRLNDSADKIRLHLETLSGSNSLFKVLFKDAIGWLHGVTKTWKI